VEFNRQKVESASPEGYQRSGGVPNGMQTLGKCHMHQHTPS
jgi:hypothetical protein